MQVEYIRSDMREIDFECEFDAVINMFTAFGYLETDDDHLAVLRAVGRALKPGGKLLIDVCNRDWIMHIYQPRDWRETKSGWVLVEDRKFDPKTGRNAGHITLIGPDGQRRTYELDIRMYTYTELAGLAARAGLQPAAAYGNFDKSDLSRTSHRMILVAQKPATA